MPSCPAHLLSDAELAALSVGDLVQRHDGDWFTVEHVYDHAKTATGRLLVPFRTAKVGQPLCVWSDALVGPQDVACRSGEWNGTDRARVQFAPAPAPEPVKEIRKPEVFSPALQPEKMFGQVGQPTPAALAGIPLADAFRASVLGDLLATWDMHAAGSRRHAAIGDGSRHAWEADAAALERCARDLRHVLTLATEA